MRPGVTPQSGQAIEVTEPAYVHRGLTNGMPYHYVVSRACWRAVKGRRRRRRPRRPAASGCSSSSAAATSTTSVTGARVPRVPVEQRIHVLLFPKATWPRSSRPFTTDATHAAGNNDVDRWIAQVFAMDPYVRFKEAFVVWFLPRASSAHAGEGDTAFDVGVSDGG